MRRHLSAHCRTPDANRNNIMFVLCIASLHFCSQPSQRAVVQEVEKSTKPCCKYFWCCPCACGEPQICTHLPATIMMSCSALCSSASRQL